jgi:hypothetical protein
MKINHKVLSIPPYISTSWKNVLSLRAENRGGLYTLVVNLQDGSMTEVPQLEQAVVDAIFASHAKYLESETASMQAKSPSPSFSNGLSNNHDASLSFGLPLKMNLAGFEGLGAMLQHNSEQYNAPNLPEEILEKISNLTKAMGIEDVPSIPKPEPHCNCPHCQIARAMQKGTQDSSLSIASQQDREETFDEEEEITDADLRFHSWLIQQTAEKLYSVSNPDDSKEQYNVYLGSPIGCTCGSNNCEHIRAVLNS